MLRRRRLQTASRYARGLSSTSPACSSLPPGQHASRPPCPAGGASSFNLLSLDLQVNPVPSTAMQGTHHRDQGGLGLPGQRRLPQRRHHRLLPQVSPSVSWSYVVLANGSQGASSVMTNTVLQPQVHLPGGGGRRCGRAQSRLQQLLLQAAEPEEGSGRERCGLSPVSVSVHSPPCLQKSTRHSCIFDTMSDTIRSLFSFTLLTTVAVMLYSK